MTIAPWLHPLDFVGAMKSGADLGLNRAKIETDAQEAANKLGLGYAELAGNIAMNAARVSAGRDEASAANALRRYAQEQNALQNQAELAQRAAAQAGTLDRQTTADEALNTYRTGTLDETKRHHGAIEETAAQKLQRKAEFFTDPSAEGFTFLKEPSGNVIPLIRPQKGLGGVSTVKDDVLKSDIRAVERLLKDEDDETRISELKSQRDDLVRQREALHTPAPPGWQKTTGGDWLRPTAGTMPIETPAAAALAPKDNSFVYIGNDKTVEAPPTPGVYIGPKSTNQNPYKIGGVYSNGLRYLGGDPNEATSWEKVK